ncbi:NAC domain-containing protein 104-like isoform X2 [Cucurbita pepo subsp. pepo]|uniref:NAC domain-containing protein 104-like isoform X2 n=1 Tax=Cucurbita pepo subsp. pepo TaxID=3664 RepID=UPI000C9D4953|nr:NAC domain-containing protein 104-like isoform X2 [Cucurbita pepo subsp. pepo]
MAAADHSHNFNLPPGFRFHPTDEELVVHFLHRKAALLPCHPDVIPDLDLFPYDPWELEGKALGEGNRWYFYSRKIDARVTDNGYWNPLGRDDPVLSTATSQVVGMKKYFLFHAAATATASAAADPIKTNWIMHEYRLPDAASSSSSSSSSSTRSSRRRGRPKRDYSKWVLCRVYERDEEKEEEEEEDGAELSCLDEVFLSLEDLDEISLPTRIQ